MSWTGHVGMALFVMLAGCGRHEEPEESNGTLAIACRSSATAQWQPVCVGEWGEVDEAGVRILVIRNPDGGFRRLVVSNDGTRINVADGAEPLQAAAPRGGTVDIAVGDAAYRLPVAELRAP